MKYRKKPVTIEAIELKNDYNSIVECIEFVFKIGMESSYIGEKATIDKVKSEGGFIIPTTEGDMKASFGDWIIKGIKGEFYPCKNDIFAASYSPASDPTPSSTEVMREALENIKKNFTENWDLTRFCDETIKIIDKALSSSVQGAKEEDQDELWDGILNKTYELDAGYINSTEMIQYLKSKYHITRK